ncbi:MAG: hypothetical protein ACM3X4_02370 [Ignavibacteriales bacterium]
MKSTQELLLEVLLLRLRYSDNDLRLVTEVLKSQEQEPICTLMRELARFEGLSAKKQTSRPSRLPDPLAQLEKSNPEHYALVTQFREDLLTRRLLPTPSELRRLASSMGVKDLPTRRREQAVRILVRNLAAVSFQEAKTLIDNELQRKTVGDTSYADLANTILHRTP